MATSMLVQALADQGSKRARKRAEQEAKASRLKAKLATLQARSRSQFARL
jgi:hypothetical protein